MNPTAPTQSSSRAVFLGGGLIVLCGLVAYHHTFGVPFIFDDEPSILDNPSIKSLATAWSPPSGFGFTVSGRPFLNFTLALNYAISGREVWSYHVFNLLVHTLAGLTLFGLVRRTLLRPALRETWRGRETLVAAALALLWVVHPLQTEAVTYIIQRAESLMGLFFLLTLYAWTRMLAAAARPGRWFAVAWLSCLLGMACKEVMVAAPIVVLLYDRTFGAGSFRAAWRQHRWQLLALFATWLPLAWLVLGTGGDRGGTFALTPAAFGDYWLAQCQALVTYLKLSVWPSPLCFEYGVVKGLQLRDVAGSAALVALLFAATCWALWRRPVAGFIGACFFLILAPTSLLPGVTQTMVEHRMYLPLAAVLALLIGLCGRAPRAVLWTGFGVMALVLGGLTVRRNEIYQTKKSLWLDTVAKRPQSAIAQANLGTVLYDDGDLPAAQRHYEAAVRLDPSSAQTNYNLGLVMDKLGQLEIAVSYFRAAVKILPYFTEAQLKLASALIRLGRAQEAFEPLKVALSYTPDSANGHYQLGLARLEVGQPDLAVAAFTRALAITPGFAYAECNLGVALFQLGRMTEARGHLERALQLRPELADAHYNLGLIEAAEGRAEKAEGHYAESVRLNPDLAEARLNWGIALAQRGDLDAAQAQLEAAIKTKPTLAESHNNLGLVLTEKGDFNAAQRELIEALRLRPDYAQAHYNLGNLLLRTGDLAAAKLHFAEALRLRSDFSAAREMLEQLP